MKKTLTNQIMNSFFIKCYSKHKNTCPYFNSKMNCCMNERSDLCKKASNYQESF
jgi:hypothetical protein